MIPQVAHFPWAHDPFNWNGDNSTVMPIQILITWHARFHQKPLKSSDKLRTSLNIRSSENSRNWRYIRLQELTLKWNSGWLRSPSFAQVSPSCEPVLKQLSFARKRIHVMFKTQVISLEIAFAFRPLRSSSAVHNKTHFARKKCVLPETSTPFSRIKSLTFLRSHVLVPSRLRKLFFSVIILEFSRKIPFLSWEFLAKTWAERARPFVTESQLSPVTEPRQESPDKAFLLSKIPHLSPK